jgi:hypothetical protein
MLFSSSFFQRGAFQCGAMWLDGQAHLVGRLVRQVQRTHHHAVRLTDLEIRDEKLEVPGRVTSAPTRGRLRQPDLIAPAEHLGIGHAVADAVVPGLIVAVFRAVEDEEQRKVGVVRELAAVIGSQVGGELAVVRRGGLDPARRDPLRFSVTPEVDGL